MNEWEFNSRFVYIWRWHRGQAAILLEFENSSEKNHIPGMPEFRESFRGILFHIPAPPP